MNTLWQDIRFGVRMMVKAPGFTIIAVMSIALGIALNAAVFTFVNGVLFKPMPVRDPGRLVALYTIEPSSVYPGRFSYPDYVDYRDYKNDDFARGLATLAQRRGSGAARRVLAVSIAPEPALWRERDRSADLLRRRSVADGRGPRGLLDSGAARDEG
jgi:hypothetical protein